MFLKTEAGLQHININAAMAFESFTDTLCALITKSIKNGCKSVVFVCIGTDRSTGDSLGPLVGYKINSIKYKNIFVYGNLETPVHAKNISEIMKEISAKNKKPLIIAIDACLGRMEHVGCITIGEGSVKPGSGVKKDLAPVGDVFITGVVNFGGFMDFLILQNTRLNIVMKMADLIAAGIKYVLLKINNEPEISAVFETFNVNE